MKDQIGPKRAIGSMIIIKTGVVSMKRTKPGLITVLVVIFGLSLVLSGFTSKHDAKESVSAKAAAASIYSEIQ